MHVVWQIIPLPILPDSFRQLYRVATVPGPVLEEELCELCIAF